MVTGDHNTFRHGANNGCTVASHMCSCNLSNSIPQGKMSEKAVKHLSRSVEI